MIYLIIFEDSILIPQVFAFVLTFYLQNGLGFSPLVPGLAFLPLRMGFLISSLLTPKVVPKLEVGILKIGAFITIICYVFLILTVDQEVNTGLQWSQLLPFMFALAVGNGFILIPLINAGKIGHWIYLLGTNWYWLWCLLLLSEYTTILMH